MPVTVWEKFGFCLGRVSRACACLDTSGVAALRQTSTRPKTKKTGANETQYRQRTGGGAKPLADSPVVSSADENLRC